MKVYIRGKIYDGNDETIAVHLTKQDKENIRDMCKGCDIYCEYPDKEDTNKIIELLSDLKVVFK